MLSTIFAALLLCCSFFTNAEEIHRITKRDAEQPSELNLENELRRVKRIMITSNNDPAIARIKRLKREASLDRALIRLRSLYAQNLSRVKRTKRSTNFDLPELSRFKRFKDLDVDTLGLLSRDKRLKRSAIWNLRNAAQEQDLLRVKRFKRSNEFALREQLRRMKRYHNKNDLELSLVKRLRREIVAKRIPPDDHKMKKNRSHVKLNHGFRTLPETRTRDLYNLKRSEEQHFRKLHGNKFNMDKDIDLESVKYTLSHDTENGRGRQNQRDFGKLKQRVNRRLRDKHRRKMKHHKSQGKKENHHVQSHNLDKKTT